MGTSPISTGKMPPPPSSSQGARGVRELDPAGPFHGVADAVDFALDIISRLLPGSDPFVTRIQDGDVFLDRAPSSGGEGARVAGYVAMPLVDPEGRQVGSLCILDRSFPDVDDQDVRRLLDAMGRTIVTELEREEREQSLRELAETDELTGLLNRRSFERVLRREWQRARSGVTDARLVLADVNALKPVNDERGHPAGDQLLRDVAGAIGETIRDSDFAGRIGGDEFGLILVGADERAEARFRDRLTAALEGRRSSGVSPSVAIGETSLGEAASVDEAVTRADRRMYRDKRRRFRPYR